MSRSHLVALPVTDGYLLFPSSRLRKGDPGDPRTRILVNAELYPDSLAIVARLDTPSPSDSVEVTQRALWWLCVGVGVDVGE